MARRNLTVSERVVQAVATETETDPLELPPLYDTIDPDALDAFGDAPTDTEIRFRYAGCTVLVEGEGTIRITDGITADDSSVGADFRATRAEE